MKKIKTVCHICGKTTKSETAAVVCERCGADLKDAAAETVQKKAHCQYTTGKVGQWTGWLYLTNKRIACIKDDTTGMLGGAVGGFIGSLIESAIAALAKGNKQLCVSIPLAEIVSVEEGKIGLLAKAVAVNTKDGVAHKFGLKPEWVGALKSAISSLA